MLFARIKIVIVLITSTRIEILINEYLTRHPSCVTRGRGSLFRETHKSYLAYDSQLSRAARDTNTPTIHLATERSRSLTHQLALDIRRNAPL